MAISYEEKQVKFDGVIYETEVVELRDFLAKTAPEHLLFDFAECEDVHTAVLQQILAYKKIYSCEYVLAESKFFHKVLEGFDLSEDSCN